MTIERTPGEATRELNFVLSTGRTIQPRID
jgi:hypothetical protein